MESRIWLVFVALAGLCWGTYVPLVTQGGKELKNSYAAFLCIGIAYFVIAVVVPIVVLWLRGSTPNWSASGITFATLAGVAGALGALCVTFAVFEFKGPRLYVAPLIFAAAPLINTLVSLFWHPDSSPQFGLKDAPHWTLYLGIVLVGAGAALVLYSKEAGEARHAQTKAVPTTSVTASADAPKQ